MAITGTASLTISEMREFAGFTPAEQRYIRRSLDIGLGRQDAFKLWARDAEARWQEEFDRFELRLDAEDEVAPLAADSLP